MKKSKLLFLAPCAVLTATTPFITSCNKHEGWDGVEIVDDIMHTLDTGVQEPPEGCNDLISALKTLSKKDLQKELIFDLYSCLFLFRFDGTDSIYDLCKSKCVTPIANISECTSEITNDNNLVSTFKGYINFVFTRDYKDTYKQNDFIQITFFVPHLIAQISRWNIGYIAPESDLTRCIYLVQQRINGEDKPIIGIDTIVTLPNHPNRNNWKK